MELRSLTRQKWASVQFLLSIVVGWYVCGEIMSTNNITTKSFNGDTKCMSCSEFTCPKCDGGENLVRRIKNMDVENSYFRKYPFAPQNVYEDIVHRWKFITSSHAFENINAEPRVGANGMWRLERENVEKNAKKFVKSNEEKQTGFKSMLRRTDPFMGTNYYVKLTTGSGKDSKGTLVQMQRGFYGSKPKLIEVTNTEKKELVTIIAPLSKVTDRFHMFLQRFEETVLQNRGSGDVKLLFVIFEAENGKDESTTEILNVLDKFRTKHPYALVQHELTKGKFSRALGIHNGVLKCRPNELMLFLDVDMYITKEFFDRIRRNTIMGKSVYFPVTFSQYDPKIIDDASNIPAVTNEIVTDKSEIDDSTGYWIHYAFGIAAMYRSDYDKVGGFKLDIKGWGGEDVDLYKKFISDPDIDVFSAVDKELVHIYHSRGCDPTLADDQYRMCVGAWAETLGSQIEVAGLYLESTIRDAQQ